MFNIKPRNMETTFKTVALMTVLCLTTTGCQQEPFEDSQTTSDRNKMLL